MSRNSKLHVSHLRSVGLLAKRCVPVDAIENFGLQAILRINEDAAQDSGLQLMRMLHRIQTNK